MPLWIFAALGEPRLMARDEGEDLQNKHVLTYGEPSHSSSRSMLYNIAGLSRSPVSRDGSPLFQARTVIVCDSRMQVFLIFYESLSTSDLPAIAGNVFSDCRLPVYWKPWPDAGMLSAGVKI